ncbi:MAG: hypothetical protein ACK51Y_00690 [Burkholderiales bacterium]
MSAAVAHRSAVALCFFYLFAAALAALALASGEIILIGLVLGALAGLILIERPGVTLGIVVIATLALAGPIVMHWPQAARLPWMLSLLGVLLMVTAVLHGALSVTQTAQQRPWPAFAVAAVASLMLAMVGALLSTGSLEQGIAGLKRQYAFWGVLLVWLILPLPWSQVRRLGWALLAIGMLQLPLAIYQRLVLMPRRLNLPDGVVPVDIVAGSFEGSLTGGANNNVMAFFLVLMLAALAALRREGLIRPLLFWPLMLWLAAPLVLGETKMVIVFLPIALAVVYADLIRLRPGRFALGTLAMLAVCAALFYNYVALQVDEDRSGMSLQARIEQNLEYNLGNRGYYGGASLNRSNVVDFWWSRHGLADLRGTFFGHGVGSAHGSRGTERLGHMDRQYPGYAIGLTAVAVHLWEQGLVGAALILGSVVGAWRCASRLIGQAREGLDRALCRTLAAGAALLIPIWLMLEAWVLAPSQQVLAALILGLTAWRARMPVLADDPRPDTSMQPGVAPAAARPAGPSVSRVR